MKNIKLIFIVCFIIGLSSVSYGQDWPNLNRYRKANTQLVPPKAGQSRVVFMGNSITDIWDDRDTGFFAENPYIDRGISGQTTPQMLIRFRADVIQLNPAAVVILAGTNDIAGNTGPSTLGMIEDNLASMSELAAMHNIKVILCSVLPAYKYPWSPKVHPAQKIVELNKWIKHYADGHGFVYVDYYSSLTNEQGGMKEEYSKDGVHPNKAGYNIMEPIIVKAINQAVSDKGSN